MGWRPRIIHLRLEDRPGLFTAIQSAVVCCLAALLAAGLWTAVGRYYPIIWYQVFAAVVIAAVLSPIFLFPSYRTAYRLRIANRIIERHTRLDPLTRLPNLHALIAELDERYFADSRGPFAVHMIDAGRLKQVNESFGHLSGSRFVRTAAQRIREGIKAGDFAARMSGSAFVVLQSPISGDLDVRRYAEDLKRAFEAPAVVDGQEVPFSIAIGSAVSPEHGETPTRILQAAEIALGEARKEGRPQLIYHPQIASIVRRSLELETALPAALKRGEFFLEFQPIFRIGDLSTPVTFEALLRWKRSDGEVVSPEEFIPAAERSGLIVPLGAHALRLACLAQRAWRPGIGVSVNVSPRQIFDSDFLATLRTTVDETGIDPRSLDLEITESLLIEDAAALFPVFSEIRKLGARIVLDDFGSGYSGIPYLRQFSFDKIKIDKTLVDEVCHCAKSVHILEAVAEMGRQLGFAVTAEGIDTEEKRELLLQKALCTEMQGFLLGRPVALTGAILMVATRRASREAPQAEGGARRQLGPAN